MLAGGNVSPPCTDQKNTPCAACGMQTLKPNEYHPFAACVMYQKLRNANVVRANLMAVVEYGRSLERARPRRKKLKGKR